MSSATSTTRPTTPTSRRSRRPVLLLLAAGLVLGALVGLLFGPRSLSPGTNVSGDRRLADDFRATLGSDRGLASVEVARFQDGRVTYAGLAPVGTFAPSPQTAFELGSITKTMTGMLLADAVQRGEMRLGAPVSDYLPELAGTPAGGATLQQLATHHSGLPELPPGLTTTAALASLGNTNPYALSVEKLLQLTRDTPLHSPGRYAYSNLGMSLLGHAEARAARVVDWPTLARQRLLVPLGMTHTTFATSADQLPAGMAPPHQDNGWPAAHWYGAAFSPAGSSTVTTAEDAMRFATAVLDGRAPGLAALEPVADAGQSRIGLGWMTTEVAGRTLTWHNGATGGYRSMLALDRGTGRAVLVLNSSNRWVDRPALQLAAAAPGAALRATDAPKVAIGPVVVTVAGLVLLVSGVLALATAWHRIALLGGAVNAVSALVLLRVRGPWSLAPAELWTALVGLTVAGLVFGARRWRSLPTGPERRRWWGLVSAGLAVVVLAVMVWAS